MDPNVTLHELLEAVLTGDAERADELAEALQEWLRRGGFAPLPTADSSYQGWKNYETWAVHRFLTGSEENDRLCRGLARAAIANAATCPAVRAGQWTIDGARQNLLAESLKEFVDTRSPLADEASVYSDLLGSALCEVDWQSIGNNFLERGTA